MSNELGRVRQVARKDKDVRFTALLQHLTVKRLEEAYRAICSGVCLRRFTSFGPSSPMIVGA